MNTKSSKLFKYGGVKCQTLLLPAPQSRDRLATTTTASSCACFFFCSFHHLFFLPLQVDSSASRLSLLSLTILLHVHSGEKLQEWEEKKQEVSSETGSLEEGEQEEEETNKRIKEDEGRRGSGNCRCECDRMKSHGGQARS